MVLLPFDPVDMPFFSLLGGVFLLIICNLAKSGLIMLTIYKCREWLVYRKGVKKWRQKDLKKSKRLCLKAFSCLVVPTTGIEPVTY